MDHTAELLRVCGIAVICAACILLIGKGSGLSFALRLGGGLLIFGIIVALVGDSTTSLRRIIDDTALKNDAVSGALGIMLKALGIAFLSKLCADVCRDCGEGALSTGIETVGRIAIISLCIPIIAEMIGYAAKILEMGN